MGNVGHLSRLSGVPLKYEDAAMSYTHNEEFVCWLNDVISWTVFMADGQVDTQIFRESILPSDESMADLNTALLK